MARAKTPSFVTTVELQVTPEQAVILRKRFNAARMVYNACLSHYLKHCERMRNSKDYRLYKGMRSAESRLKGKEKEAKKAERTKLFRSLRDRFELRKHSAQYLCEKKRLGYLFDHMSCKEAQATRIQAFKAFDEWCLSGFKTKEPKFRQYHQLDSIQSQQQGSIRWKPKSRTVEWDRGKKNLVLPAIINESDDVVMYGLAQPIKFTRLTRKVIRGKERFFAQLVHEGTPYRKEKRRPQRGIVGIDIGTQTIAAVSENGAFLDVFCGDIKTQEKTIRRLNRAMDRSRRETNPQCFDEKGRWIKGQKFTPSARYKKLRQKKSEIQRKISDHRSNLHGQMIARILELGNDIRMEKLDFRSMTKRAKKDDENPTKRRKRFGKSIAKRAPGEFVRRLDAETKKWEASLLQFNPRHHALSQTCFCGQRKKKGLGNRRHKCKSCRIIEQRDLFSAYLCRFVNSTGDQDKGEKTTFHAADAQSAWPGFCTTLRSAWENCKCESASAPTSLGLRYRPIIGDSSSGEALAEERATASATVSGPQREPEKNVTAQAIFTDSDQFLRDDSTVNPSVKTSSEQSGEDSG